MAENWEQYKVEKSEWDQYKVPKPPSLLQSVGRSAIEAIPVGTAMIAEIPGMLGAIPTGGVSAVAAPALGYLGGTYLRDIVKEKSGLFDPSEIQGPLSPQRFIETGTQGAAAAPLALLQRATIKALGPWASKLTTEQLEVAKNINQFKLAIAPQEYSPSWASKLAQKITDWFPTGRVWSNYKRGQLEEGLNKMTDDILGPIPNITKSLETLKGDVGRNLLKLKTEYGEVGTGAYKNLREQLPEFVNMENTINVLEKYHGKVLESKNLLEEYRKIGTESVKKVIQLPGIEGGKGVSMTRKELVRNSYEWDKYTVEKFYGSIKRKISSYDVDFKNEIYGALKQDLEKVGEKGLGEMLEKARELWTNKIIFNKNPLVQEFLGRGKGIPGSENMVIAVERSHPDELIKLFKSVDKETKELIQANFVKQFIDDATIKGGGAIGDRLLTMKLGEKFLDLDEKIKTTMPEIYPHLSNLSKSMIAASHDVLKSGKGEGWWLGGSLIGVLSPTAYKLSQGDIGSAIAYSIPAGFSFAVSKSLMNPTGWLRGWLTTGLEKKLPGRIAITSGRGLTRYGTQQATQFAEREVLGETQ